MIGLQVCESRQAWEPADEHPGGAGHRHLAQSPHCEAQYPKGFPAATASGGDPRFKPWLGVGLNLLGDAGPPAPGLCKRAEHGEVLHVLVQVFGLGSFKAARIQLEPGIGHEVAEALLSDLPLADASRGQPSSH